MKRRYFYLKDVGCTIKIEEISRKEMLAWLDDYVKCVLENNYYKRNMYDTENDSYEILYNDGKTDYIDNEYDGHKIKRTNIVSIVNCNAESNMTYGNFSINECGVVHASATRQIDDKVIEVDKEIKE